MKICSKCKINKQFNEFYKYKEAYHSYCKVCHKQYSTSRSNNWYKTSKGKVTNSKNQKNNKYYLKALYGMNLDEYNQLFILQNGRCDICGVHQDNLKKSLSVDHCHKTNKIRGLLCNTCNTGLGYFKDSEENLSQAIQYLKKVHNV